MNAWVSEGMLMQARHLELREVFGVVMVVASRLAGARNSWYGIQISSSSISPLSISSSSMVSSSMISSALSSSSPTTMPYFERRFFPIGTLGLSADSLILQKPGLGATITYLFCDDDSSSSDSGSGDQRRPGASFGSSRESSEQQDAQSICMHQ